MRRKGRRRTRKKNKAKISDLAETHFRGDTMSSQIGKKEKKNLGGGG